MENLSDFILPVFFLLLWLKVDRDEQKLNKRKPPRVSKKDYHVIYKKKLP